MLANRRRQRTTPPRPAATRTNPRAKRRPRHARPNRAKNRARPLRNRHRRSRAPRIESRTVHAARLGKLQSHARLWARSRPIRHAGPRIVGRFQSAHSRRPAQCRRQFTAAVPSSASATATRTIGQHVARAVCPRYASTQPAQCRTGRRRRRSTHAREFGRIQ